MQNRFKFRIWNNGEMHHNDFVVTATGFVGKITEEFLGKCVFNQEDLTTDKECVLMQCTGLKDKNGKLIYIGDVVKDVATNSIYKVGEKKCAIYIENDEYIGYFHELSMAYAEKRLEVIGNIYENKEILNEI